MTSLPRATWALGHLSSATTRMASRSWANFHSRSHLAPTLRSLRAASIAARTSGRRRMSYPFCLADSVSVPLAFRYASAAFNPLEYHWTNACSSAVNSDRRAYVSGDQSGTSAASGQATTIGPGGFGFDPCFRPAMSVRLYFPLP